MTSTAAPERAETIVIGGGQAGLSVGYHLSRRGLPFLILEANQRIGDSWRSRWDSLRLFTPARFDGLAGMPFPAPAHAFPTKDEMANYLESYAARFNLPIRTGVKVDRLTKRGNKFVVSAGNREFEAENVVVAMADFQSPRVPSFASELDPAIVQLHSSEYRNLGQLREGAVLVAGAGNSGAEIAIEVARSHATWMAGRETGHVPFRIDGVAARVVLVPFLFRVVFHRVLTIKTPMGRKARPNALKGGAPLIRVKRADLTTAGVQRVPRVVGVRNGLPLLEDARTLDVTNVIWCTGFHPGFSWIDLPVFADSGAPLHEGGVVTSEPGLYFVGLHFLYAFSSTMIHGVGRDADRIAAAIAARRHDTRVA
ncbi:MAG TPA: FAD-dependent oxidoreductase [Gemmatimonadaceae bacterium]|nr:FAD-dependent oxidoreductase [Gemmatimonadaceae bacterium]